MEKDKLQRVEQQTKDELQEASERMQRVVKLSQEKGSSSWLSIIPLKEIGLTLNKKEFHDAVSLQYDWEINDIASKCVFGERFDVNHTMICMKWGFVVQRHDELRYLEAESLNLVCKDVETEPVLRILHWEEVPTRCKKQEWASTPGVFGTGNDLPSLMLGYATQMQNRTPIVPDNRFTANMKTKRNESMQSGFYRQNKELSHH